MSSPEFLRKDYRIDVMKIAKKQCYDQNGKLDYLPEKLQIAIISIYYESAYNQIESRIKGFLPFSLDTNNNSIYEYFSKLTHVTTCLEAIPEYISSFKSLRERNEDKEYVDYLTREIYCDLIYGTAYKNFTINQKIKYKLGLLKPVIKELVNARPSKW